MHRDVEKQIITNYQNDEKMMILLFAQWCINHKFSPEELYVKAYPNQAFNTELKAAIELTASLDESTYISDETMLDVLSLYGNDDLAFVLSEAMAKRGKVKS